MKTPPIMHFISLRAHRPGGEALEGVARIDEIVAITPIDHERSNIMLRTKAHFIAYESVVVLTQRWVDTWRKMAEEESRSPLAIPVGTLP